MEKISNRKFYRTQEWYEVRDQVLERDDGLCRYCGHKAATADHVTPRSRGGRDTPDNLVAVCDSCNAFFNWRYFEDFESKKKALIEEVVQPYEEFMAQKDECEKKLGRSLSSEEVRKAKIKRFSKGIKIFNPRTLSFKYKCLRCGRVNSVREAKRLGWPTTDLCMRCNDELEGIEQAAFAEPKQKYTKRQARPESYLPEKVVRATKTPEEKLEWNKQHADWLDQTMVNRRVCRECGIKTKNYKMVNDLPYCISGHMEE